ncbi:unnamed protein product [Pylaiella littoralis]
MLGQVWHTPGAAINAADLIPLAAFPIWRTIHFLLSCFILLACAPVLAIRWLVKMCCFLRRFHLWTQRLLIIMWLNVSCCLHHSGAMVGLKAMEGWVMSPHLLLIYLAANLINLRTMMLLVACIERTVSRNAVDAMCVATIPIACSLWRRFSSNTETVYSCCVCAILGYEFLEWAGSWRLSDRQKLLWLRYYLHAWALLSVGVVCIQPSTARWVPAAVFYSSVVFLTALQAIPSPLQEAHKRFDPYYKTKYKGTWVCSCCGACNAVEDSLCSKCGAAAGPGEDTSGDVDYEIGDSVPASNGGREGLGTRGHFPGSPNDAWRCSNGCAAPNQPDETKCTTCSRTAGWAQQESTGTGSDRNDSSSRAHRNTGVRAGVDWDDACDMEVKAPVEGGGTSEAPESRDSAPPTTGRSTRSGRSTPPVGGSVGEPTRKKRKASCGKSKCGYPCDDGKMVCYACGYPPTHQAKKGDIWRHYQSEESAADARASWAEMDVRPPVIEGREPQLGECFCERMNCMFKAINKYQLQCAQEDEDVCSICGTGPRGTSAVRHVGVFMLGAFRMYYSQTDPLHPSATPLGSSLLPTSPMCQACYMKGYKFSRSTANDVPVKLSAEVAYDLARTAIRPPSDTLAAKREAAFASVRLHLLGILKGGDMVYSSTSKTPLTSIRMNAGQRDWTR